MLIFVETIKIRETKKSDKLKNSTSLKAKVLKILNLKYVIIIKRLPKRERI